MFKYGDKVRCILGSDYGDPFVLVKGEEYTVQRILRECDQLNVMNSKGEVGCGWYESRFELVLPTADTTVLPSDSAERKKIPMCSGLLDYFPAALAEVAKVSFLGNEKHNPGQPLHHARGKSMDHPDCIVRHLAERGGFDGKIRHTAALAWRALALLQEELEAEGAPKARGAK